MYVKKRMSLLLFAALAMVLFTACGRWDFSREAAKAANEAQGETLRVEFTVEQKFTNALRAALEENIQPADVEKAMRADESIEPFLTSGYRLDVYPLRADISAKDAAKQLAAEFVNRLAGCEDKGHIAMVKADNGYFYEAVLTYKHGSSGGSSGGASDGDNDPDAPVVPDDNDVAVTVTTSGGSTDVTVKNGNQTVEKGSDVSFTFTRGFYDKLTSVKVNGDEIFDTTNKDRFSVSYANDMDHTYTFALKNVQENTTIEITFGNAVPVSDKAKLVHSETKAEFTDSMTCAVGPFNLSNLEVQVPLDNSNKWGDTGDFKPFNLGEKYSDLKEFTATVDPETITGSVKEVTIHFEAKVNGVDVEKEFTYSVTVNPTKSDYGYTKYLTGDDFDKLKKALEGKLTGMTLGTDEEIQAALNNANVPQTVTNDNGRYGTSVEGKSIEDILDSINNNQKITKPMFAPNDEFYITVRDSNDGVVCHIYYFAAD